MTGFPMDTASVGAARTMVGHAVAHCGQGTIDVARLLTSELATNALVHGQSPFDVVAHESHGVVHVEVSDTGRVLPAPLAPGPTDPHGRGLQLLEALAARWGIVETPRGKTVWFDLLCHGGRPT